MRYIRRNITRHWPRSQGFYHQPSETPLALCHRSFVSVLVDEEHIGCGMLRLLPAMLLVACDVAGCCCCVNGARCTIKSKVFLLA